MEADLSEELRFHLEKEIEKNLRAGMAPEEAATPRCAASAEWSLGVAAILLLAALIACCGPARRAAKVDPMVALRCE